ncbi:hypothetical protein M2651_02805 [Clostridium sp. SYSU_GA19001]|uniref:ABC transporter permease n=1 Tax=Clostridium caldaquaticum TaxID=2940653 RepID=UPI0020771E38|nr:hypothetical protein [Clostridium caldaquaticum]MCM8709954.1 hypothetical protein [Clostridium caldaquaticum]
MNKGKNTYKIIKSVFLSILFPFLMFWVMFIIVRFNNITYFGTSVDMWRTVLVNTATTSVAAVAIWLQLKNGRFDFSGGATMLLSAILAGNLAQRMNNNPWIYLVLCLVFGVGFCLITGIIYIFGRLPIIICTIGVALLYESFTYLIFNSQGLSIMSNASLTIFGKMPYILFVLILALVIFIGYCNFTVPGKQAKILSNNQQAGVNIGIKEEKNVLQTFICCGLLLGLAGVIYGSQNTIAPQSGLSTANTLFSYIAPAYMGMFIGLAGNDAVGVVMASFGMEILNYGLNCIGLGAGGWQQIILGCFMLSFYSLTAQFSKIGRLVGKLEKKYFKIELEN